MRFALLLTAAAFVATPAISQPLHTEHFDVPVGDLPNDHGVEDHNGDESLLSVTDSSPTLTGLPPSAGISTIVEQGLGSHEDAHIGSAQARADNRNGDNATSYTSFRLDVGSTSNGNAGFEDQRLRGAGEYEAIGYVQDHGATHIEQSYASVAGWGISLVFWLVVAMVVIVLLKQ